MLDSLTLSSVMTLLKCSFCSGFLTERSRIIFSVSFLIWFSTVENSFSAHFLGSVLSPIRFSGQFSDWVFNLISGLNSPEGVIWWFLRWRFSVSLLIWFSTAENPWSLSFYTDGVTPGYPLTPMNKRKFQACYWSFIDLGANALPREESWFTVMTELETVFG